MVWNIKKSRSPPNTLFAQTYINPITFFSVCIGWSCVHRWYFIVLTTYETNHNLVETTAQRMTDVCYTSPSLGKQTCRNKKLLAMSRRVIDIALFISLISYVSIRPCTSMYNLNTRWQRPSDVYETCGHWASIFTSDSIQRSMHVQHSLCVKL